MSVLFKYKQAETQQKNPIYYHQNLQNRLSKIDNDRTVARLKVQALDMHQNPESNQAYSFYICQRLFF